MFNYDYEKLDYLIDGGLIIQDVSDFLVEKNPGVRSLTQTSLYNEVLRQLGLHEFMVNGGKIVLLGVKDFVNLILDEVLPDVDGIDDLYELLANPGGNLCYLNV